MSRCKPHWNGRRGVAAIEFAMTAPILFLLLYAALELGHANMVLNAVEAACYEGARMGIVPGASTADCTTAAQRILDVSNIRGSTITVTPNNLNTNTDSVSVRISLPYTGTAVIPPTFTRLLSINRQCELIREKP
jgi:Flp pilus assembly protein TadG